VLGLLLPPQLGSDVRRSADDVAAPARCAPAATYALDRGEAAFIAARDAWRNGERLFGSMLQAAAAR
jgi:hypothetical protein